LYDSRTEAEEARERLISEAGAMSPRIISRETAAAVDSLGFTPADVQQYRDSLRQGAHLLVAQLPAGSDPARIVEMLERPADKTADAQDDPGPIQRSQGVEVRLPDVGNARDERAVAEPPTQPIAEAHNRADALPTAQSHDAPVRAAAPPPEPPQPPEAPQPPEPPQPPAELIEEARVPVVEEELRIGKRQVARGGARVRSFTAEEPIEAQVSLQDEIVDIERRPAERRLSERDLDDTGLFKERMFEITEMREEPVVSKIAVVREEIIVRKSVHERQETVRDTVRRTQVEIEDLKAG
jgi:stress response protein YsnF